MIHTTAPLPKHGDDTMHFVLQSWITLKKQGVEGLQPDGDDWIFCAQAWMAYKKKGVVGEAKKPRRGQAESLEAATTRSQEARKPTEAKKSRSQPAS